MFTLFNDNNSLNIDSTYNNLGLYKKVYVSDLTNNGDCGYSKPTTNTNITYNQFKNVNKVVVNKYSYIVPANINTPLIAISRLYDKYFAGGIRKDNYGNNVIEIFTNATDFYLYIFSSTKVNKANCGLEIYSANNELIFDSENKYLRILPQISNDRTCALLLYGAVASEEVMQGTSSYIYFMWCFYVNSSGVIVNAKNYQSYFSAHWGGISNNLPKPNYNRDPLILDVTDY